MNNYFFIPPNLINLWSEVNNNNKNDAELLINICIQDQSSGSIIFSIYLASVISFGLDASTNRTQKIYSSKKTCAFLESICAVGKLVMNLGDEKVSSFLNNLKRKILLYARNMVASIKQVQNYEELPHLRYYDLQMLETLIVTELFHADSEHEDMVQVLKLLGSFSDSNLFAFSIPAVFSDEEEDGTKMSVNRADIEESIRPEEYHEAVQELINQKLLSQYTSDGKVCYAVYNAVLGSRELSDTGQISLEINEVEKVCLEWLAQL